MSTVQVEATATTAVVVDQAPAAAKESKPKMKKTAVARKTSAHPPFYKMISDAIVVLKERTGSSQYAIQKSIEENHKQLPANFRRMLLVQLKRLVAAGKLVKVKNSFKLAASTAPAAKPAAKKAQAKKAAVKKVVAAKLKKTVALKPKEEKVKPAGKVKKPNPDPKPKTKTVAKKAAAKPMAEKPAVKPKAEKAEKVVKAVKRKAPAVPAAEPAAKNAKTVKKAVPAKEAKTVAKGKVVKKAAPIKEAKAAAVNGKK